MFDEKELAELWQGQPLAESEANMQAILGEAERFQRRVQRRNWMEYAAAAGVVIWTAASVPRMEASWMVKLGAVSIGVGAVFVAIVLRRRGHAAKLEPPFASATTELMRWHRSELVRQRDLLSGVPRWYLAPFAPGLLLIIAGRWLEHPEHGTAILLVAALCALVFIGVALLNRRGARKLTEQIENVDRELGE